MNGILIIDKPKNYTSRDIVNIVGKKLQTKKIGHTGTLDPIATGVLVLCIGNATKLVELLTDHDKEYLATLTLGIETDTLDSTGTILKEENISLTEQQIDNVLEHMQKTYDQTVPIYSAVKINGKKLYEYARENKEIELPSRAVTISSIKRTTPITYENGKISFSILTTVSKGTYIRSLIRDIATNLNTIGIMTDLRRTRQGNFYINQSYTIEQIEKENYQLYSIEEYLQNYHTEIVDIFLENKIKNGQILEQRYPSNWIVFKNKENKLLALYQTYSKDTTKIKPYRMF